LPGEKLERMTLILQQTYGENDSVYVAKTREIAARLPCQTVSLTRFMGPEESAMLRLSADVFVLAIKTDAFSASMQEYLYAGACVIKGQWLQYPQLADMGIPPLAEFTEFGEIPKLISLAMDGKLNGLTQEQRALFPRLYSWDAVRESWLELYKKA
ncbi:MAG: glycosyltransferase, partial [Clostridia bacterium]|nr:glycosyltransferase [Clostridia bacterium]